jgi:hypothetical protein
MKLLKCFLLFLFVVLLMALIVWTGLEIYEEYYQDGRRRRDFKDYWEQWID